MPQDSSSLLDELDALFGLNSPRSAPAKPKGKTKAAPARPPSPPPRPEKFWLPEAVVLYNSFWKCVCGGRGTCSPQLAVRERQGRFTRLTSIHRVSQYSHLPREIENADPIILHACPSCFQTAEDDRQLSLPFGDCCKEELARFIESGLRAADFAEALVAPANYSNLTPEARDLRLSLITNLKESFRHAD